MTVKWVEEDDIYTTDSLLPSTVSPVVGISNTHQVLSFSPGEIHYRCLSCFCSHPEMCLCHQPKKLCFDVSASKASSVNVEQQSAPLQDVPCIQPKEEATNPSEVEFTDSDDGTSYTVGKFVIVKYDDRPYVGQIIKMCNKEAEINCMKQVGDKNVFIWPDKPDCIYYSCDQIACTISEPEPFRRSAKLSRIDWLAFNMV